MKASDIERIEAYLLDQLPEEERAKFEAELQTNAALQSATERLHDLIVGISIFGEEQFKANIQSTEQDLQTQGFFLSQKEIDLYLKGEASTELQQLIEKRQDIDPDFQQSIATQKDLLKGINEFGEQDFLAQIQQTEDNLTQEDFFKNLQNESQNKKEHAKHTIFPLQEQGEEKQQEAKIIQFNWRKTLSIAAAIGGLIISIWAISIFLKSSSPIQDHFLAYEDQLSPELEETGFLRFKYLDTLQLAMQYYNTKRYETAIPLFRNFINEVSSEDPYFPPAQFYLAQSLIATQSYDAAQSLLESLVGYSNFVWNEDIHWYLALLYLERKQFSNAQIQLDFLATSSKYGEQAKDVEKKYIK
ncbi:MAG: hypothetical protein AAF849_07575 [Bacteroidota bacterium]